MHRRAFLALSAALLASGPARGADHVAAIVGELDRRGYTRISVSRTFLGRARIVASGPHGRREIILNPVTGEILRDLRESPGLGAGSSRDLLGGEGRRPGRNGGRDDDDDDDDDDRDDDDRDGDDDRDSDDGDDGDD